jgi:adenylate cyclase
MIIAWAAIVNFYSWIIISNMNIYFDMKLISSSSSNSVLLEYIVSGMQYLEGAMFGVIFGTLFTVINIFTDHSDFRKYSYGKIVVLKSILYILSVIVTSVIIYILFKILKTIPEDLSLGLLWDNVKADYFVSGIVYITFFIILTNFILQISKKFGPETILNLFTGKYHKPKGEERIFMFLDMKSSTAIAEKLGHEKYSQFIRNCYHDLTNIVLTYNAEIYQYVGDEVVLCWPSKKGLRKLNCLNAFFAYEKELNRKGKYYLKEFGEVPKFKAGMDMGQVTVTEIGDIKRDIAYHGDVLNTASRIQENCNKFNQKLLISENIEKQLDSLNGFSKKLIGEINLRGKEQIVKIYGINSN